MVDVTALGDRIEKRSDLGNDDAGCYAYWMAQEKIAEKEERKWVKRAREIVKRYRDERPEAAANLHRFNILWSNVQTLIPTLYGKTPKPDVERRFKDADPVGRMAATLLERALSYSVDACGFDDEMAAVVEDRLLPGRGVCRVLYIPTFGEPIKDTETTEGKFEADDAAPSSIDNVGDEGEAPDELREVVDETVDCRYVFWEDYREGPARKWKEVPWVRYRSYMTRDELIARFGKKKGKSVNLDYTPKGMAESVKDDPPPDLHMKAVVHEVWDKTKKEAIWYAPGTPDVILDRKDDPLGLNDFFPNPAPLLATTTNDKRIPVPDFIEYQDQARELDSLTARIDRLTRALKVSGVYPGEEKQVLQQLIDEGTENRLIPVGDWAAFTDKGGLQAFIQWMPIQQIAETLLQLYAARDKIKATLYEITGIGDIIRGETNPNETATAQSLKANFSTRRIVPQQKAVGKFAGNMLRLMGNVIADHFSPKTISRMTGYPQLDPVPQLPPPPPRFILAPQPPQGAPQGPPGMPPGQPQPGAPQPPMQPPQQPGAPMPGGPPNQGQPMNGMNGQPGQPQMPPVVPNPAYAQWQQMQQQVQQVVAANQQKQKQFDDAVALIRQDSVGGFRIDIEADSTIAPDEQAEKSARVEFLQQMVPLLEQVVPMAMGNPALAAVCREITLFAARGFRVARPMEETLEQAFDALAKMPPKVDPAAGKAQGSGADSPQALAVKVQDSKLKAQTAQQEIGVKTEQIASDERIETMKLAAQQQRESEKLTLEAHKAGDEAAFRGVRMAHIEARDAKSLT